MHIAEVSVLIFIASFIQALVQSTSRNVKSETNPQASWRPLPLAENWIVRMSLSEWQRVSKWESEWEKVLWMRERWQSHYWLFLTSRSNFSIFIAHFSILNFSFYSSYLSFSIPTSHYSFLTTRPGNCRVCQWHLTRYIKTWSVKKNLSTSSFPSHDWIPTTRWQLFPTATICFCCMSC